MVLAKGSTDDSNVFLDASAGMRILTVCADPTKPETDDTLFNFAT